MNLMIDTLAILFIASFIMSLSSSDTLSLKIYGMIPHSHSFSSSLVQTSENKISVSSSTRAVQNSSSCIELISNILKIIGKYKKYYNE
ncbi:uncharacterized protein OCT59_000364 [Rhizophagus irregularis]|uniref:uncharacterized protein n=1 Tax=Rhizophagus irregularis TaxID=588596 RepID=UPI003316EC30|nr:hypothetical protein OCT59_000364 [Rhizophagus irregularis]